MLKVIKFSNFRKHLLPDILDDLFYEKLDADLSLSLAGDELLDKVRAVRVPPDVHHVTQQRVDDEGGGADRQSGEKGLQF